MSKLPVIVGFGGINPAGRGSFHHAYNRLVIDALANDPQRMEKTGQVWIGAELGELYGVKDINGQQPPSHRAFFGETTSYGEAIVE